MTKKHKDLNVDLLKRIKKRIQNGPEDFNMSAWFKTLDWDTPVDKATLCNTSMCIAGEAVYINGLNQGKHWRTALKRVRELDDLNDREGAKLLGLSRLREDSEYILGTCMVTPLFHGERWPSHYRSQITVNWDRIEGEREAALELIDDMIAGTVKVVDDDQHADWWRRYAVNADRETAKEVASV